LFCDRSKLFGAYIVDLNLNFERRRNRGKRSTTSYDTFGVNVTWLGLSSMGFSSLLVNYSNEKRFNNFKPIASDAFPFVESRPIILGTVFFLLLITWPVIMTIVRLWLKVILFWGISHTDDFFLLQAAYNAIIIHILFWKTHLW